MISCIALQLLAVKGLVHFKALWATELPSGQTSAKRQWAMLFHEKLMLTA